MTAEIKYFPRKQTKAAMSFLPAQLNRTIQCAALYKNAVRRLTRIIKVKEIEMQGRDELGLSDVVPNLQPSDGSFLRPVSAESF